MVALAKFFDWCNALVIVSRRPSSNGIALHSRRSGDGSRASEAVRRCRKISENWFVGWLPIKEKDVTSQARRGYFASKGVLDPIERAKTEIQEEFLSRDEIMEIPVTVRTEFQKTNPDAARLTVAARIDLKGSISARNWVRLVKEETLTRSRFLSDCSIRTENWW
jgi:hypothetical protein